MGKVKIKYQIDDGYVGNRPKYFYVDKKDWDQMWDEEKEQYVYDEATKELSVSWSVA